MPTQQPRRHGTKIYSVVGETLNRVLGAQSLGLRNSQEIHKNRSGALDKVKIISYLRRNVTQQLSFITRDQKGIHNEGQN